MAGTLSTMEQTLEIYRKAPTYIDNIVLVANTAKTVTAPVGATHMLFSATGNFMVRWLGTPAAVPGGDVTDGTGVEINPIGRAIGGKAVASPATTFSVVAPANCTLAIAWCTI